MDKKYSADIPQAIINTAPKGVLNYGVYKVSDEELLQLWQEQRGEQEDQPEIPDEWFREEHKYGYYAVEIPMAQWTRDGVINAIIRDKYRIDEMEAITNNMAAVNAVFMQTLVTDGIIAATKYLKDSINDANTARFKEMQEWRAMAKKIASEIFDK
jgi:hypothetical protein